MTGLTHTFSNDSAELARKGYASWVGNTIFQIADVNNTSVDAIGVEGWQIVGRVTAFGDTRGQEVLEVRTGTPETLKNNVMIGDDLKLALTYDHPTRMGIKLTNGSNYADTPQYAASGQTTVSSSTSRTVTVVASNTGLAVGDMIEVDLTSGSTYGNFKEWVWIVNVNGTTITHTQLAATPNASADFKKIEGWGASQTSADAGVKFQMGNTCPPSYKARKLTYVTCPSRLIIVQYYPEIQVTNPIPLGLDDPKALITGGFTASVIAQAQNITDDDGNTQTNAPVLAEQYIVPFDSDN